MHVFSSISTVVLVQFYFLRLHLQEIVQDKCAQTRKAQVWLPVRPGSFQRKAVYSLFSVQSTYQVSQGVIFIIQTFIQSFNILLIVIQFEQLCLQFAVVLHIHKEVNKEQHSQQETGQNHRERGGQPQALLEVYCQDFCIVYLTR